MKIETLVTSIGEAVQDAHKIMEQKYISNFFDHYFQEEKDEDLNKYTYMPKSVEIKLSDAEDARIIPVPVAVLVRHTNINLDYVKLNLNITVINEEENEIEVTSQAAGDNNDVNGAKSGELELMFKCQSAPEGVSRIETYLNGTL